MTVTRKGAIAPAATPRAHGQLQTRFGFVSVTATAAGVRQVHLPRWAGGDGTAPTSQPVALTTCASPAGNEAERALLAWALDELAEYFDGARRTFTVPLDPVGTPFLRRAWEAVERVPYGETRSYGEIAAEIGAPGAARAVGRANAINPVPPFVPCHRIVGSDGRLTGYGPGLPLKARLLRMEDALPADPDEYDAWAARLAGRCPGHDLRLGVRRTRAFCRPGCPRAHAEAELPPRMFLSPDDAVAAGFTPCARCGG